MGFCVDVGRTASVAMVAQAGIEPHASQGSRWRNFLTFQSILDRYCGWDIVGRKGCNLTRSWISRGVRWIDGTGSGENLAEMLRAGIALMAVPGDWISKPVTFVCSR